MIQGSQFCSPNFHAFWMELKVASQSVENYNKMISQDGIRYLFQTKNDVTFALAGTGHSGMECALTNLVEPGDVVCVLISGVWGQRCEEMVRRLGAVPKAVQSKHFGAGIDLQVNTELEL